jgi:hypothetical protein
MTSVTGQCPTCGADRNAEVIAVHKVVEGPTREPLRPTCVGDAYRILKCLGCQTIYFQHEELELLDPNPDEDDDFDALKNYLMQCKEYNPDHILYEKTSHWPSIRRKPPDWRKLSDTVLVNLLNSVYTALEHDLGVLSAIGMGVVFERAAELIGVDPSRNFTQKLDDLHLGGHISAVERERLEVLTNARGAAAHRGWVPDAEQLNVLIGIMEHFVNGLILKDEAGKLKQAIPARQKHRKAEPLQKSAELIELRPPKV